MVNGVASGLAIARRYRHLRRFRHVVEVLLKHGFGYIFEHLELGHLIPVGKRREYPDKGIPVAVRFRLVLEELGPTFIKLGQVLSTRPDILPRHFIEELEKLQADVPSTPFSEIKVEIERELGASVAELFAQVDEVPLATASIGQVHRARLHDGQEVVIKVQRPGVAGVIKTDTEIMMGLARLAEDRVFSFSPVELVDEFRRAMQRELDYTREGQNIDRFRRNFLHRPEVQIPQVYWSHSSQRVLTMEYIEGKKLTEFAEAASKEVRKRLAVQGARAFMQQVLVDGFFHGDPHPGNILVKPDGKLALLDFGVVGRLREETMDAIAGLFLAVLERDEDQVVASLERLGVVGEGHIPGLREEISELVDRNYGKSLEEIRVAEIIQDILNLTRRYGLHLPGNFVLLVKGLITLEGVGRFLDPEFNVVEIARPFAKELLRRQMRPEYILRRWRREWGKYLSMLLGLPRGLDRFLRKASAEQLAIRFKHEGLERLMVRIDIASNRIAFGMITAALIIGSSLIMLTDRGPQLWGFPAIGLLGFCLAGIVGIWLMLSILRSGRF